MSEVDSTKIAAFKRCIRKVRTCQSSAAKVDPDELGAGEIYTPKVGSREVIAACMKIREIQSAQVGIAKIATRATRENAAHMLLGQTSVRETAPSDAGAGEIDAAQVGEVEITSSEGRISKGCLAKIALAEVNAGELRIREVRSDEYCIAEVDGSVAHPAQVAAGPIDAAIIYSENRSPALHLMCGAARDHNSRWSNSSD